MYPQVEGDSMRCLVTGGTGFLGSHLAARLVEDDHDVILYDTRTDGPLVSAIEDDVTIVQGDIREAETLCRTLQREDVDTVVHTAALLRSASGEKPTLAVDVNGVGTTRLLELADLAGVERAVLASSIAVYGYSPLGTAARVTESSPCEPTNVYGACKVLNEQIGRHVSSVGEMSVTALRFGTVYGPGQARGSSDFKSSLFERTFAGEPVTVRGSTMRPNWLYVRDAVESIVLSLTERDGGFSVFNVHSGIASLEEAVRIVEEERPDASVTLREEPPDSRPGAWPLMDISRAEERLGYTPRYDLREGIRDYYRTLEESRG